MTRRQGLVAAAAVVGIVGVGLLLVRRFPLRRQAPGAATVAAPATAQADTRRIKARLFYVADDGVNLTSVEQDVLYGEGTVEQAKAIVNAQLAAVGEPLVSAVPPDVKLRALFVTPEGQAYVDLTPEVVAAHPGGSQAELLTVFTIVQALTVNLPAVKSVQLLVDGKEVDTLAGHVDLRRPLVKNPAWIQ